MLRLLSLAAIAFAFVLPLILPKAAHRAAHTNRGANLGRGRQWGRVLGLFLLPILPKWAAKVVQWSRGPSCPRCKHKVGKNDVTCSHCGNVLTSVSYRVEKPTA